MARILIVMCGVALLASQVPAAQAGASSLVVDARVVDRSGRAVTDLTADDFEVRVDGAPRRISAVRYEPASASDQPSSVLVAVDRQNLRIETSRLTLDAAAAFVAGLSAPHAVGLMVLPEEKVRVAIGQPAADVAKALRALLGAYNPRMPAGDDELSARTALHRVISVMSTVKGRRSVVFLADRMYDGASTVDTARRAALQGVAFYVIAADAPMMTGENQTLASGDRGGISDGLAGLAAASGGALLRRSAGAGAVFERLALELSGQYLVTFETDASDAGRHGIRVGVKRGGLDVRARREFVK
ncbi:MAG: VWA domain-containing protein [Acidobacteria bacterium]|nr:VWA domain-containing protein [Acidobacteriota bacterium]